MCDSCGYADTLEEAYKVQEALEDEDSSYATNVLEKLNGIIAWIEDNKHSTPKQQRAITNWAGTLRRRHS